MSIIMIPAAKCSVSRSNVRKTQDPEADLMLRASIVARGVIQNLVGLPVPRKKGQYEITAGGRRLTQTLAAIADGSLPDTFEVPVLLLADRNDASETSLAENFIRAKMNPADECIAFKHIIETEAKTPEDVAKRLGLTERFVLGRLRLADLAEPIFTALRDGAATLDIAQAYAATSDAAKQLEVFKTHGIRASASSIRNMVMTTGYNGNHPRVKIIDRDDYVAAGGRIDGDLFSDNQTEMWLDDTLVDQLADKKLQELAEATREARGFGEVRVALNRQHLWTQQDSLTPFTPPAATLTSEQQDRAQAIADELECLEARAEQEDEFTAEDEAKVENLQQEYGALTGPTAALADEDKSKIVAFIELNNDGQVYLSTNLYVIPEQKSDTTDQTGTGEGADISVTGETTAPGGATTATTPAQPEKPGVSQRLAAELAIQKNELVALHVANDPHFAFDLGVFIMADRVMQSDHRESTKLGIYGDHLPSDLRSSLPESPAPNFKSGTQASESLGQIEGGLDKSWYASGDARERFDAFRKLGDEAKAAWLGWTVARTLRPTENGKTGASFLDHLGSLLEIDVAAWWRPTADNYFGRGSKKLAIDAIREIGGAELTSRYGQSKKNELSAAAEKLFAGASIVEPEYRQPLITWVPPEMRFHGLPATPKGEDEAGPEEASDDAELVSDADTDDTADDTDQPVEDPVDARTEQELAA